MLVRSDILTHFKCGASGLVHFLPENMNPSLKMNYRANNSSLYLYSFIYPLFSPKKSWSMFRILSALKFEYHSSSAVVVLWIWPTEMLMSGTKFEYVTKQYPIIDSLTIWMNEQPSDAVRSDGQAHNLDNLIYFCLIFTLCSFNVFQANNCFRLKFSLYGLYLMLFFLFTYLSEPVRMDFNAEKLNLERFNSLF